MEKVGGCAVMYTYVYIQDGWRKEITFAARNKKHAEMLFQRFAEYENVALSQVIERKCL